MQVFPLPGSLPYPELNFAEAVFERLTFASLPPREPVLRYETFEIIAD
jgi:hypothetical protein